MKTKIFQSILVIVVLLFVASWFYKLIYLLVLSLIWKKEIKEKIPYRHTFMVLMAVLAVGLFHTMPRYRLHTSDRIQLIYQDQQGNPVRPPMTHYLANVLLPEEEIMNLGIWAARCGATFIPYVGGGSILHQFQMDDWHGKIGNFYRPARKLNWSGCFMMSGTTSQVFNMLGMKQTQSVYLVKPKHFDAEKKYPVVFFCHGALGNWKLYQGLWKDLDDCIVLSVGTKDWSGIFRYNDIKQLFTRQLPFLKQLGYQVDESQLHIMGLSNGGTAVNVAYNNFSKRLKSITYLSTGIHQTYPVRSKILMVGGGKDPSAGSNPGAYRKLQAQGSPSALYWDKDETHFILVNHQDQILEFLNREMLGHEQK